MRDKIDSYFNADKEAELVAAISRLVRIPSVKGRAMGGIPFGHGPYRCLEEALNIAGQLDLSTKNYDNYVGLVDLNQEDTILHILGHLDVVGEGTGWTVTDPFNPFIQNGMLFGRGTADDKGPLMAAMFAMKAIKDMGIPLKHNVRLILGTDEESGSEDIKYYYEREPYAPYTFTPDSDFPLINIEKGSYKPAFSSSWEESTALPRVTSLTGGFRINVVPPEAEASLDGLSAAQISEILKKVGLETGVSFVVAASETGVQIHATGLGGHAAEPEKSNNALTAMLRLLDSLPLADCRSTKAIHSLAALFPHGDYQGKALGIQQSDRLSGDLTVSLNLLTLSETGFEGQFDSRTALYADDGNCRKVVEAAFAARGISCSGEMSAPHHTPENSFFVQTLLKCYRQYTGEVNAVPLATGGGTYVHDIPGGVAFGCNMPGFDSNLHGPNERIQIADLMTSCKIFTQAIIELCS
jgi:succinyl-diaminopimelate desuccinylase